MFSDVRVGLLIAGNHKVQHVTLADTPLLSLIFSSLEVGRRCDSGREIVAMMQAAEPWEREDPAARA